MVKSRIMRVHKDFFNFTDNFRIKNEITLVQATKEIERLLKLNSGRKTIRKDIIF